MAELEIGLRGCSHFREKKDQFAGNLLTKKGALAGALLYSQTV